MIALVDCNNFFASCERLFRPDLKGVPVLVLSNNDGCVVARSNEVKELGIPMGVPYFQIRDIVAKNKVTCFSSNFALYSNMSQRILGVLSRHTPQIEVYSIDEAFLQLNQLPIKSFQKWGDDIRAEIAHDIGMPVSVGIAPTKALAKLASAYAKKHKQTCVLDPAHNKKDYKEILSETPIGAVWGIGWRMEPKLKAAGIRNALHFVNTSEEWLHKLMGINGTKLHRELRGITAYSFDEAAEPQKTLMASRSFGHTIKNPHELESAVASFASQAAFRLRKHNQTTKVFGLYLRFRLPDGATKGQSTAVHLSVPTNDTTELVTAALRMMEQLYDPLHGYKKAGVFAHHLSSAESTQANLFDEIPPDQRARKKDLMNAIDSINQRYGTETVHIGSIDTKATKWHARKERMSPAYTTDWSQLPFVHPLSA